MSGRVSTASNMAMPPSGIPAEASIGAITIMEPPGMPGAVMLTAMAFRIRTANCAEERDTP
jgi:hypothetical protein